RLSLHDALPIYVSAVRGVLGIAGAHARGCEQIVDRCAREIVWFYLVAGVWIDVIHLALRIDVVDPGVACAVVDDVATKVVESGHNPIPHSTDGKIAYEVLRNVGGDDGSLLIADPEAECSSSIFIAVAIGVVTVCFGR